MNENEGEAFVACTRSKCFLKSSKLYSSRFCDAPRLHLKKVLIQDLIFTCKTTVTLGYLMGSNSVH